MNLGIRAKLFLAFLLCTLLVIVSMMLFTRWSIENGFIEYVENRQDRQIQRISRELTEIYTADNSWDTLQQDKRLWLSTLFDRQFPARGIAPDQNLQPKHRPPSRRFRHFLRNDSRQWPSDKLLRRLKNSDRPRPFEYRIMLFDNNSQPIFGRVDQLKESKRYPLTYQGNEIGFLALIKAPTIAETGQIRFIEKQHSSLIYITLLLIALSTIIALVLAHRFIKPLQAFRHTARQLASGRYDSRIHLERQDELGDVANDINALAKALQASETDRRQWVADIAHELRTPLSIIQSELEALQDDIRPLDKAAVDSLHADSLRLRRLIDDLYELSMTDLGALSYQKTECDLNDVLMESIEDYQNRFDEAKITIQHNLNEASLPNLYADPHRLSQLFSNLLENTLRYSDPGGQLQIQIQTALKDDQVVLDFQDSSPGVNPEALPHLFERLFRVEASRNRAAGGAGLGLAIVSNIIDAHQGTITAANSPLGGLWIHITLPVESVS